jgi:hypothetical protein
VSVQHSPPIERFIVVVNGAVYKETLLRSSCTKMFEREFGHAVETAVEAAG